MNNKERCGAEVIQKESNDPYDLKEYGCNNTVSTILYCSVENCPLAKSIRKLGTGNDVEDASTDGYEKIMREVLDSCIRDKEPRYWIAESKCI